MAQKMLVEINAMGQATCGDGACNELHAYMSNQAETWRNVERCYRYAELWANKGDYVSEYLEAMLFSDAVNSAAYSYVKEYIGPHRNEMRHYFPLDSRRNCAKLLVAHFESERAAGNSWGSTDYIANKINSLSAK